MTVESDAPVQPAEAARPAATYRTNLVTLLLSTWFTIGLFLDAWAHNNVPELETFFTPWHAVYYSGFVATAAWVLWTCRAMLPGRRWDLSTVPIGYAAALVSLAVFALAAVGDLTWHQVFGIEQSIDILFSPTHLLLGASMVVIVTTPLRAAWSDRSLPPAPRLSRLLPAVGSVALATTIVLLFLQYANAYTHTGLDIVVALSGVDEHETSQHVSAIAVTSIVLLLPLLLIARRWPLPSGIVTIIYLPIAGLAAAVTGFENMGVIVSLLAAGVVADLIGSWLRPGPERPNAVRGFAAVVPLVTWTAYVFVGAITPHPVFLAPDGSPHGTDALIELSTGIPVVQAMLGLLVALIMTLGPERRWPTDS